MKWFIAAFGAAMNMITRLCFASLVIFTPLAFVKADDKPAGTKIEHVSAKQAAAMIAKDKPVVIDVRTPAEFSLGHIAGAKNVDFHAGDFAAKLTKLDKSATYLVHCASGGRSTSSLATFQSQGFAKVIHLDGGFHGWEDAGLPVETK